MLDSTELAGARKCQGLGLKRLVPEENRPGSGFLDPLASSTDPAINY